MRTDLDARLSPPMLDWCALRATKHVPRPVGSSYAHGQNRTPMTQGHTKGHSA